LAPDGYTRASALLVHVTATLLTGLLPAALLATLSRLLFLLARLLSATTLLAALILPTLVLILISFRYSKWDDSHRNNP
jgi:hypothetical protein